LPPLANAEGELRSAMARSFVAYIVERDGRDTFLRFLRTAQPGRVDAAARDAFGTGLADLEESWAHKLASTAPTLKTGEFLRLTLRYLRPHTGRQIEISCYMLLGLAFTMVFPFALRRLLDTAIPSGEYRQVADLLIVLSVVLAISMLADLRRAYVSATVSASIVRTVRGEMFDRLQVLSSGWFARSRQGDVLARLFADVAQMESGVSHTLREGMFQVLSLVVSAIVLLLLQPQLGVIVLLAVPLVAIVYRLMAHGAQRRSVAVQEELAGVYGVAAENYAAQPVIKAFALERREGERFGRASARLVARQLRLQLFSGFFGLSVNAIVTTLRLVILALGAWMVMQGDITLGTLVAFTGVVGQAVSPLGVLSGLGQQMQAATGSLRRINEVLEAVPEITDGPDAIELPRLQHEIRLTGVDFSYIPGHETLHDIDCTIPAGGRVAFVGPTGAGKSSLLQLLQRLYDVDAGSVLFDGVDVRTATVASLRSQIGVVFQDSMMFNTTIRENIALAKPGATDAEVEAAARSAELHDEIVAMPTGYDTTVGERGARLSGGQRQRLAIARALVRDPSVLLLDEATSALDPRTERLIADTLQRAAVGRTTIAVTHRIASISDYDRIFVMADGSIAEQGTHAELVAAGGLYADLWAEQTGVHVATEPRPPDRPERARRRARTTFTLPIGDRRTPAHAREPEAMQLAQPTPFVLTEADAWGDATGAGVRVAILDSGIDATHPDLGECVDDAGVEITAGDDGNLRERVGSHTDANGHGTACAGIIHSIAPDARLTSVKVLGPDLSGSAAALLHGLDWAIAEGFDIVNLSLGTNRRAWALAFYELCDRAYFTGTFVVAAANNVVHETFPSMYASVTSVACGPTTDPFRFDWNPDPPTEFLARGIDVDVAAPGGGRTTMSGNSFAAAHISGIAALIKSRYPDLRPFQLKTALFATARNVQMGGQSVKMSGLHGRIAPPQGEDP